MNLNKNQITSINQGTVQVCVKHICKKDFDALETQWLQLEKISSTSFFLSWKWIGCWLKQLTGADKIYLITAKKNDLTVGLGIFTERNIVRHHFIKSKQWFLHRTGIDTKDQIWIENNSFLLCDDGKKEINDEMWQYLQKNKSKVDEFVVHVAKEASLVPKGLLANKYIYLSEQYEFGYKIALTKLPNLQSYLTSLSKNTRQQFNRSIKSLAKQGDIEFSVIEEASEQIKLLESAKHWHIEKWQNTSTPSGFTNDEFKSFHQSIITSNHPSAKTLMGKLTLDKNLIGCLYCLTHEKKVYFYLSCLKPFSDNKIKLGMNMHISMIEWLITNNQHYQEYDFLAGEARYKKSLSTTKDEYFKLTIQKRSIKFSIEKKLKELYKKITK